MSDFPFRYLARVTIEFETPFLVGADASDALTDSPFLEDANGLPMIPGTSIAGVLRHAAAGSATLKDKVDELFGYQNKKDGRASQLSISSGLIHSSQNQPVEKLLSEAAIQADPVLTAAKSVTVRDHVRIGHNGTGEGTGKFDEISLSPGHRFSFEIELIENINSEEIWNNLLNLLYAGGMRLGSRTRRGFGAFQVVSLKTAKFDLSNSQDFDVYCKFPVSLSENPGGMKDHAKTGSAVQLPAVHLNLKSTSFWMIGGGFDEQVDTGLAPVKTRVVEWKDGKGNVSEEKFYVPATAIKGALSHRTAFHFNRLNGDFVGDDKELDIKSVISEANKAVYQLFGSAANSKDRKNADNDDAVKPAGPPRRGRVIINDVQLKESTGSDMTQKVIPHVAIDRFTGGARDGMLYNEKPLKIGSELSFTIQIEQIESIDQLALDAFDCAIQDLAKGRLPLGSGASRGHGFFRVKNETVQQFQELKKAAGV